MRKGQKSMNRIFSTALCVLFMLMQVVSPSLSYAAEAIPAVAVEFDALPSTVARVVDVHADPASTYGVVVIEDAHAHLEVQKNIARVLDHAEASSAGATGQLVVAVEGSPYGLIDTSRLKLFSDESLHADTMDQLLSKGVVGGVEHRHARFSDFSLYGLEDMVLYDEGRVAYFAAQQNRETVVQILDSIEEVLSYLKESWWSQKLQMFTAQYVSFAAGAESNSFSFSFLDMLKTEAVSRSVPLKKYTTLAQFYEVQKTIGSIDDSAALEEIARFNELAEKHGVSVETVDSIPEVAKAISIDLNQFPHIARQVALDKFVEALDGELFLRDVTRAYHQVMRDMLSLKREKELFLMSEYLSRLESLAQFSSVDDVVVGAQTVADMVSQLVSFVRVYSSLSVSVDSELMMRDTLSGQHRFYRIAQERDERIVAHIDSLMSEVGTRARAVSFNGASLPTVFVVAGGYHTDALVKKLKSSRVSCAVIRPSVSGLDMRLAEKYERVLAEQPSSRVADILYGVLGVIPFSSQVVLPQSVYSVGFSKPVTLSSATPERVVAEVLAAGIEVTQRALLFLQNAGKTGEGIEVINAFKAQLTDAVGRSNFMLKIDIDDAGSLVLAENEPPATITLADRQRVQYAEQNAKGRNFPYTTASLEADKGYLDIFTPGATIDHLSLASIIPETSSVYKKIKVVLDALADTQAAKNGKMVVSTTPHFTVEQFKATDDGVNDSDIEKARTKCEGVRGADDYRVHFSGVGIRPTNGRIRTFGFIPSSSESSFRDAQDAIGTRADVPFIVVGLGTVVEYLTEEELAEVHSVVEKFEMFDFGEHNVRDLSLVRVADPYLNSYELIDRYNLYPAVDSKSEVYTRTGAVAKAYLNGDFNVKPQIQNDVEDGKKKLYPSSAPDAFRVEDESAEEIKRLIDRAITEFDHNPKKMIFTINTGGLGGRMKKQSVDTPTQKMLLKYVAWLKGHNIDAFSWLGAENRFNDKVNVEIALKKYIEERRIKGDETPDGLLEMAFLSVNYPTKAVIPVGFRKDGTPITKMGEFLLGVKDLQDMLKARTGKEYKFHITIPANRLAYDSIYDWDLVPNNFYGLDPDQIELKLESQRYLFIPDEQLVDKYKDNFDEDQLDAIKKIARDRAGEVVEKETGWGHAELLIQLVSSGDILRMLQAGEEYQFVRNVDNSGAKIDWVWLAAFGKMLDSRDNGIDVGFLGEFSPRPLGPSGKGGAFMLEQDMESGNVVGDKRGVVLEDSILKLMRDQKRKEDIYDPENGLLAKGYDVVDDQNVIRKLFSERALNGFVETTLDGNTVSVDTVIEWVIDYATAAPLDKRIEVYHNPTTGDVVWYEQLIDRSSFYINDAVATLSWDLVLKYAFDSSVEEVLAIGDLPLEEQKARLAAIAENGREKCTMIFEPKLQSDPKSETAEKVPTIKPEGNMWDLLKVVPVQPIGVDSTVGKNPIHMPKKSVLERATTLVEYLAEQDPLPADIDLLLVMGSDDLRVAEEAARVYNKSKNVKQVVVSGGGVVKGKKEAVVFKEIMVSLGVPAAAILIETESRTTTENVLNTIKKLQDAGIDVSTLGNCVLMQKPLLQKRSAQTFRENFPEGKTLQLVSYAPYRPSVDSLETAKEYYDFLEHVQFQFTKYAERKDSEVNAGAQPIQISSALKGALRSVSNYVKYYESERKALALQRFAAVKAWSNSDEYFEWGWNDAFTSHFDRGLRFKDPSQSDVIQYNVNLQSAITTETGDNDAEKTPFQKALDASEEAFKNEFVADEPTADIVIFTAGNKPMSDWYEERYNALRGTMYREDVPFISVPDPEGDRVGNGGALSNSVTYVQDLLNSYLVADQNDIPAGFERLVVRLKEQGKPSVTAEDIADLRIVIVQAGGFGKRLPAAMAAGSKVLIESLKDDGENILATSDVVLRGAYKFTQKLAAENRKGIVILNGDGFLTTMPDVKDGISLVAYQEKIKNAAGELGVVVVGENAKVVAFVEKPKLPVIQNDPEAKLTSEQRKDAELLQPIRELPMFNGGDKEMGSVPANSASIIISFEDPSEHKNAIENLLELDQLIKTSPREVDTSGDILIPQTSTVSKSDYLIAKLEKMLKDNDERDDKSRESEDTVRKRFEEVVEPFFSQVYDYVMEAFHGKLYAVGYDEYTFYRDPAQTKELTEEYRNVSGTLGETFGFNSVVQSKVDPRTEIPGNAAIFDSVVGTSDNVGDPVIIDDGVVVGGSILKAGSVLNKNAFAYRVKGVVKLSEGQWVTAVPVQKGGEAVGRALVYMDTFDNSKASLATATLFGKSFAEWVIRNEVKLDPKTKGLWDAAIWPVIPMDADLDDFEYISWMSGGEGQSEAYKNATYVSLKDMSQSTDYSGIRDYVAELNVAKAEFEERNIYTDMAVASSIDDIVAAVRDDTQKRTVFLDRHMAMRFEALFASGDEQYKKAARDLFTHIAANPNISLKLHGVSMPEIPALKNFVAESDVQDGTFSLDSAISLIIGSNADRPDLVRVLASSEHIASLKGNTMVSGALLFQGDDYIMNAELFVLPLALQETAAIKDSPMVKAEGNVMVMNTDYLLKAMNIQRNQLMRSIATKLQSSMEEMRAEKSIKTAA